MIIKWDTEKIATTSFLGLTIFFVIYNTLISLNLIPKVIGGGYGLISIITFLFIILGFIPFINSLLKATKLSIIYLYYFIYIILIISISTFLEPVLFPAFTHSLITLLHGFVLFYIGYYLNLNNSILNKILLTACLVSFVLLLYYYLMTGSLMFNASQLDSNAEDVASYQAFGRTAFLVMSLIISNLKGFKSRIIYSIIGIFILFILGSRSEAIAFFLFSILVVFYSTGFNISRILMTILVSSLAVYLIWTNLYLLMDTRFGQLFSLEDSSSWQAREEFYDFGILTIKKHFILGDFGSSYTYFGNVGSNAHNIIAAWANFGLLGFILFTLSMGMPVIVSFYLLFKRKSEPKLIFSAFFGLACLFLVLVAKSNFWILPPFYWGVFLSYFRGKHE